jgi:hypothetical protein
MSPEFYALMGLIAANAFGVLLFVARRIKHSECWGIKLDMTDTGSDTPPVITSLTTKPETV